MQVNSVTTSKQSFQAVNISSLDFIDYVRKDVCKNDLWAYRRFVVTLQEVAKRQENNKFCDIFMYKGIDDKGNTHPVIEVVDKMGCLIDSKFHKFTYDKYVQTSDAKQTQMGYDNRYDPKNIKKIWFRDPFSNPEGPLDKKTFPLYEKVEDKYVISSELQSAEDVADEYAAFQDAKILAKQPTQPKRKHKPRSTI